MERIATSRSNREIMAIRLAGAGAGGGEDRPAILLVANLEGPRVFSSAMALDHAWKLAEGYAADESSDGIRAFLDSTVVYIVPRVNPDAADARFMQPLFERTASGQGVDDDRDGRQGEDPPSDVNGDGFITQIRVLDPEGEWMGDPTDPRVLIKADRAKGERGKWKLYTEGRDLDGDERVAEDATNNAQVDRNFPAGWQAHDPESGLFPSDEPEVQGLMEFLLAHPEIVMVLTYGGEDNLVETPKGIKDDARSVKRVPPSGMRESDVKYLKELGERYRETTTSKAKGKASGEGRFTRWCYEHRGLWTLSAALWEMPDEAPSEEEDPAPEEAGEGEEEDPEDSAEESSEEKEADGGDKDKDREGKVKGKGKKKDEPKPSADAKKLLWVDAVAPERFHPWKSYEHPELGTVEIGGFAPFARLEPPDDDWADMAQSHLDYLVSLGATLPRVGIAECTREELGDGVWRVTTILENDGLLPFQSRSMRLTRTTRPGKLRLELPEGATLLGGSLQTLVTEIEGSGGREEVTWLVLSPDALAERIRVHFDSDHAGLAEATPEVKP